MKVIAVFNVDDEKFKGLDYDDLRAKLEAPSYTVSLIDANVRVRPLPQEWTMDEVEPCAYNEGFVDGFNHCIYLITGETE